MLDRAIFILFFNCHLETKKFMLAGWLSSALEYIGLQEIHEWCYVYRLDQRDPYIGCVF
jgi:hypothetical protein